MENVYNRINFIVSGGALKLLTDFLGSKELPALIVEPKDEDLQVLDAVGITPDSLVLHEEDLHIRSRFPSNPPMDPFEVAYAQGNETWPCILRIRGEHWELYVLLKKEPEQSLMFELQPYAGLLQLWRTFQRVDEIEKKLARLSYMILATKSTLASIFEPMPLQYFASFLSDVLHESLFPKTVAILKDEGDYLTVLKGDIETVPERTGFYTEQILPPNPIMTRTVEAPFEAVLPVVEGETRLFCLMRWDDLPDAQMLNFMELLGNLAARAVAINNLRNQTQKAATYISSSEFTVLSISNVLKILKSTEDRERFLSMLTDILMEQARMQNCILAVWDTSRQGYAMVERRVGQVKANLDPTLLPAIAPVGADRVMETSFNLAEAEGDPDTVFKSWGLRGCPWPDVASMHYLFPICDNTTLVGIVGLASQDKRTPLDRGQLAALHLITQFAAYEFRRL